MNICLERLDLARERRDRCRHLLDGRRKARQRLFRLLLLVRALLEPDAILRRKITSGRLDNSRIVHDRDANNRDLGTRRRRTTSAGRRHPAPYQGRRPCLRVYSPR